MPDDSLPAAPVRVLFLAVLVLVTACLPDRAGRRADADTPGAPAEGDASALAWWMDWQVEPRGTMVDGAALAALDPSWVAATSLGAIEPPPAAAAPEGTFARLGAAFALDGDFNVDGRVDHAVVGVYRARDGSEGRFLAVLSRQESGEWSAEFLRTLPGPTDFSALRLGEGNRIAWVQCLDCDTSGEVWWNGTVYESSIDSCCADDAPVADAMAEDPPPPDSSAAPVSP